MVASNCHHQWATPVAKFQYLWCSVTSGLLEPLSKVVPQWHIYQTPKWQGGCANDCIYGRPSTLLEIHKVHQKWTYKPQSCITVQALLAQWSKTLLVVSNRSGVQPTVVASINSCNMQIYCYVQWPMEMVQLK